MPRVDAALEEGTAARSSDPRDLARDSFSAETTTR
jgi:hypothetical protein